MTTTQPPPNTRVQRTRSSASRRRSPLTRSPLGGWWRPLWLLLLSVAMTSAGVAECGPVSRGSLSVHVIDAEGSSLPGVAVALYPVERPSEEAIRGATDPRGELVLAELPLASYEVRAELPGLCADYAAVVVAGGDRIARVTLTMSIEGRGCSFSLKRSPTPSPRPLVVLPIGRTRTPVSPGARP